MFCSFICDQMICFEVSQSLVGNLQVKPRVVHLWLEWSGGLWGKGGAPHSEAWGWGVGQRSRPGGLGSSVEFERSWPRRGQPTFLWSVRPCRLHPAQCRMSGREQEVGSSPGLSLLCPCSSRLPGLSVVLIVPEFSSGRQFSQSKHWAFCWFLFCCHQ